MANEMTLTQKEVYTTARWQTGNYPDDFDDCQYCPSCHWTTNVESHRFCAYGHGPLSHIREFYKEVVQGL